MPKKPTFYLWLSQQRFRTDWVGAIAERAVDDGRRLGKQWTVEQLATRLDECAADAGFLRGFCAAVAEYSRLTAAKRDDRDYFARTARVTKVENRA